MQEYAYTQKQNQFAGGGIAGGASTLAPEPTGEMSPVVTAAQAFAMTQDLCTRLKNLADRLVGSVPTPVNNSVTTKDSPAVFPALGQAASVIIDLINDAHTDLLRIERNLP